MKRSSMFEEKKISILGTEYTIKYIDPAEDEEMTKNNWAGICSEALPVIRICDLRKHPDWTNEPPGAAESMMKETLRHEITHAFFNESGLKASSNIFEGAWSKNEELIDWIAIQGPKMVTAWEEAGCL